MGIFGNSEPTQPPGLNLGQTGAPNFNGAQQSPWSQPQPQNMGMGMGMGMGQQQPQQNMWGQQQQQPPPSEMDMMIALMNANVPVERWLSGPNFQNVVNMFSSLVTLSIVRVFKDAKFVADDEGNLKMDTSSLPSDIQTVSVENIMMELQKVQSAAHQSVQQCQMLQQQIAAMAQQSVMGGALSAAMADEGMMKGAMGAVGTGMRGFLTGGR